MKGVGLTPHEVTLVESVIRRFPSVSKAILFGSRAKGTHRSESDVDLALLGADDDLTAQAVSEELDLLPLPYRFDVVAYSRVHYAPLREHIDRVGIVLYRRDTSISVQ